MILNALPCSCVAFCCESISALDQMEQCAMLDNNFPKEGRGCVYLILFESFILVCQM